MNDVKRYTVGEEIFNSVTHGVTALLAIVGATVMITLASCFGDLKAIISSIVFGLSMVLLYSMSTLYHALPFPNVKKIFRIFDHSSIPILIAGSYTPFCVVALDGNKKGFIVILIVWLCAALAVALNTINLDKFEKYTLVLYVAMGWAIVVAIRDIVNTLPFNAFLLLLLGGISYTVGIIFYKLTKIKYMHGVWHVFVTLGSVLHYLCVLIYVLPMTY